MLEGRLVVLEKTAFSQGPPVHPKNEERSLCASESSFSPARRHGATLLLKTPSCG
jgi:hypothetical protein